MFPLPLDNVWQLKLRSDDSDVHASKNAGPAFYRCSPWLVLYMSLISTAIQLLREALSRCMTYSADTLLCMPVTSFALERHAC